MMTEDLLYIIEDLIVAIEFECPPIRDGNNIIKRTLILENEATEARKRLLDLGLEMS